MLYTFIGGPLHGEQRDIQPDELTGNTFIHVTFGPYKSAFHLLPETIEHRYIAVSDELHYCTPDKITS
ncbi:MAG TPA: hypothetical protein VFT06_10310 [Flavisolibacter sp.]|nr:hypothetical protein [Flavisolibacter sp.]